MKLIDLTGKQFSRWIVIERVNSIDGNTFWKCRCVCGTIKNVLSYSLQGGKSKSCGCYHPLHPLFRDLTGKKFGKLKVITRYLNNGRGRTQWECSCECGTIRIVSSHDLLNRHTKSCGCSRRLKPYKALYNDFLHKIIHPVKLTYKQFVEFTKQTECHYCGAEIFWTKYNILKNGGRYNLDRKDNLKGYTIDNLVVCCKNCNYGKGKTFTYEQWLQIGKLIQSWEK
jgi:hypothetical protein